MSDVRQRPLNQKRMRRNEARIAEHRRCRAVAPIAKTLALQTNAFEFADAR